MALLNREASVLEIDQVHLQVGGNCLKLLENGETVLHIAAKTSNREIFKILCERGADVNAKFKVGMKLSRLAHCPQDGETMLRWAVRAGIDAADLTETCLKHGALPNSTNAVS